MGKAVIGEWFWRFLAAVMLFAVGWTIWIFTQLNPPQLITPAAFEAAAKAKVDPAQSAQNSSHLYHEGQSIALLAARELGSLARPAWKARFWRDWLDWTGTAEE